MLFEIKINYQRQTGEDNPGVVNETYLVEGTTPADVQSRLLEEIAPYVYGGLEVPSIRKRNYFELFENADAEQWYEAKVSMITIDGEVERRKGVLVLVQANSLTDAAVALDTKLSSYDCEVVSIAKSAVVEVLDNQDAAE